MLLSFAQFEREVTAERIRHKDQIHDGQHPAIIGPVIWDQVQRQLQAPGRLAPACKPA